MRPWSAVLIGVTLAAIASHVVAQNTYKFGAYPGTQVEFPGGEDLLTGNPLATGVPTVLLFGALAPCNRCEVTYAIASTWAERHPDLQVAVVTRLGDGAAIEDLRADARQFAGHANVIVDSAGLWGQAMGLNVQPVTLIIDEHGVVRAKLSGSNAQRLAAFDEIVALAAEGAWSAVDAHASVQLLPGTTRLPSEWQLGVSGGPTFLIVHSSGCRHCEALVEAGLEQLLNDYAQQHPDANFMILAEVVPDTMTEALEGIVQAFGLEVLPEPDRTLYLEGAPLAFSVMSQQADWAPNLHLLEFEAGSLADPGIIFGRTTTPDLFVFNAEGVFVGPEPYWTGPFDIWALRQILDAITAN